MTIRIRRVRARPAPRLLVPASEKVKMQELLQSIAEIDRNLERLKAEREEKAAELYLMMKTYQQDALEVEEAVASRVTPMGRSSSHIDARAFAELVEEDDFYACVEVIKNRAEKVLSGKELAAITEVTPGRPGEETIVIKRR